MPPPPHDPARRPEPTARAREFYQRYAPRYDHETSYYDRFLLGDGRAWVCSQARGAVLEVAIGTGRNLPFYPHGVRLVGIDLTPAMLAIARDRARKLRMDVTLVEGDAEALPFLDDSFDTVVCTLALNAIADHETAIAEMYRVLEPTGKLLLVGHVASHYTVVRAMQRLLERKSIPIAGDHQTRQPVPVLRAAGFTIQGQKRSRAGIIQRIIAVKPPRGSRVSRRRGAAHCPDRQRCSPSPRQARGCAGHCRGLRGRDGRCRVRDRSPAEAAVDRLAFVLGAAGIFDHPRDDRRTAA